MEDSDVVYIDLFVLGDFLDQGLMVTPFLKCCSLLHTSALVVIISYLDLSYIAHNNPRDWKLLFSKEYHQRVKVYIFEKLSN